MHTRGGRVGLVVVKGRVGGQVGLVVQLVRERVDVTATRLVGGRGKRGLLALGPLDSVEDCGAQGDEQDYRDQNLLAPFGLLPFPGGGDPFLPGGFTLGLALLRRLAERRGRCVCCRMLLRPGGGRRVCVASGGRSVLGCARAGSRPGRLARLGRLLSCGSFLRGALLGRCHLPQS